MHVLLLTPCAELCRAKNTAIHEGNPLERERDLVASEDQLTVHKKPKLVVVAIDAQKAMLETSSESNEALKDFVGKVVEILHPCGSMAFSVPRPWFKHGHRIRGTPP